MYLCLESFIHVGFDQRSPLAQARQLDSQRLMWYFPGKKAKTAQTGPADVHSFLTGWLNHHPRHWLLRCFWKRREVVFEQIVLQAWWDLCSHFPSPMDVTPHDQSRCYPHPLGKCHPPLMCPPPSDLSPPPLTCHHPNDVSPPLTFHPSEVSPPDMSHPSPLMCHHPHGCHPLSELSSPLMLCQPPPPHWCVTPPPHGAWRWWQRSIYLGLGAKSLVSLLKQWTHF